MGVYSWEPDGSFSTPVARGEVMRCTAVTDEEQDVALPRELQDTIDDLLGLVEAWENLAKEAESPEEAKRCYTAAGCTRDAIRLIGVLHRQLCEVSPRDSPVEPVDSDEIEMQSMQKGPDRALEKLRKK